MQFYGYREFDYHNHSNSMALSIGLLCVLWTVQGVLLPAVESMCMYQYTIQIIQDPQNCNSISLICNVRVPHNHHRIAVKWCRSEVFYNSEEEAVQTSCFQNLIKSEEESTVVGATWRIDDAMYDYNIAMYEYRCQIEFMTHSSGYCQLPPIILHSSAPNGVNFPPLLYMCCARNCNEMMTAEPCIERNSCRVPVNPTPTCNLGKSSSSPDRPTPTGTTSMAADYTSSSTTTWSDNLTEKPDPKSEEDSNNTHKSAIIIGSVGGVVLLLLLLTAIVVLQIKLLRRRHHSTQGREETTGNTARAPHLYSQSPSAEPSPYERTAVSGSGPPDGHLYAQLEAEEQTADRSGHTPGTYFYTEQHVYEDADTYLRSEPKDEDYANPDDDISGMRVKDAPPETQVQETAFSERTSSTSEGPNLTTESKQGENDYAVLEKDTVTTHGPGDDKGQGAALRPPTEEAEAHQDGDTPEHKSTF